jgi:hypothetical protein
MSGLRATYNEIRDLTGNQFAKYSHLFLLKASGEEYEKLSNFQDQPKIFGRIYNV